MPSLADIIEPRPGKIAVLVDQRDEITSTGLLIPASVAASVHDPRPVQGTIVAIGPEDDSEEGMMEPDLGELRIGDRVIFGKYSGVQIQQRASQPGKAPERIIILTAKDILARFKLPTEAANVTVKG